MQSLALAIKTLQFPERTRKKINNIFIITISVSEQSCGNIIPTQRTSFFLLLIEWASRTNYWTAITIEKSEKITLNFSLKLFLRFFSTVSMGADFQYCCCCCFFFLYSFKVLKDWCFLFIFLPIFIVYFLILIIKRC